MTNETLDDVRAEVGERLTDLFKAEGEAKIEEALSGTIAKKVESGEVVILSDEEVRLLATFRQFKAKAIARRSLFKWRTSPDGGIVVAPMPLLIRDPQDATG